ncbi:MAG: phosphotransferase [Egibacteraceae bacterium]
MRTDPNTIIRSGRTAFIDWELALWGDPLYDLAVHLHKMAYLPAEKDALLQRWASADPAASRPGWQDDLTTYLRHERINRWSTPSATRSCSPVGDAARRRPPRWSAA